MGAVTGKGLAELIREEYGVRWSLFATSVGAGRQRRHLHLGVRRHRRRARPGRRAGAGVGADRRGRRVAAPDARLLQGGRADLRADDDPVFRLPGRRDPCPPRSGATSARRSSRPTLHASHAYLFLFIATAGTTITPFMQLYVQSAVVERGVSTKRAEGRALGGRHRLDLRQPDRDARSSSPPAPPCTSTASTTSRRAAQAAKALEPFAGQLRRGAVRDRAARGEPAGRGDPADHRGLRDRRDVRLREGHQPKRPARRRYSWPPSPT